MKKPYKNRLRSHRLIREAFISLLAEKPLEKITVVDIINCAELSRNTFYSHYQDVYAILDEYQNEALAEFDAVLTETIAQQRIDAPMPMLEKIMSYVEAHREEYKVLMCSGTATADFIRSLKEIFFCRVTENLDRTDIRDVRGFCVFVEVLAMGLVDLVVKNLREESDITLTESAAELNRIYLGALHLYK